MTRLAHEVPARAEDERLALLRAPADTFVSLESWDAPCALPCGAAMLTVQRELARRGLSSGLRFASAGQALVVRGHDEERALDVVDVGLAFGLTAVDLAAHEVTHPLRLGEEQAIASAFEALRHAGDSYLIIEGGPELAFYLQAIRWDGEIVLEAAAREHVRRLPEVRLARLRLLGFELAEAPENAVQADLERRRVDGARVAHLTTRALREVYGVPLGAPIRLRTNGL